MAIGGSGQGAGSWARAAIGRAGLHLPDEEGEQEGKDHECQHAAEMVEDKRRIPGEINRQQKTQR